MRELREGGAVRAIGLGVNEWEVCVELLGECELDCILLAGRYTLLEQPALEALLPLCVERRVSIICGGPFNSGILATGSRAGAQAHYNYAAPPAEVLERVRRLEQLCDEFAVPLQAAALQFPLAHPAVASVVAGCVSAAEARHCAAMFAHPIPGDFWRGLRDRGLVDARAPLPAYLVHMTARIDSHQHFWRLERGDYGWLSPALEPIYRDYLPADLEPQLARAGIGSTILVQAAPTVAETRYLLELAQQHAFIAGVVGWVDFEKPDAPEVIEALALDTKLVGLRPMIQDIPDPLWMLNPELGAAFDAMIDHDLVFDALVLPKHLDPLRELASQYPELRMVVDHGCQAAAARRKPRRMEGGHHIDRRLHPCRLQNVRTGDRGRQCQPGDTGRMCGSPGECVRAAAPHVGQRLAGVRTGVLV